MTHSEPLEGYTITGTPPWVAILKSGEVVRSGGYLAMTPLAEKMTPRDAALIMRGLSGIALMHREMS